MNKLQTSHNEHSPKLKTYKAQNLLQISRLNFSYPFTNFSVNVFYLSSFKLIPRPCTLNRI